MINNNKTFKIVLFSVFLALVCIPGYSSDDEVPTEKIQQFVDVYKKIKDQYVDEVDDTTLFNYAIEGMVSNHEIYPSLPEEAFFLKKILKIASIYLFVKSNLIQRKKFKNQCTRKM